ncbi:MAG: trypsin-like serine protease, partial [Pseudomonadota bacterium]
MSFAFWALATADFSGLEDVATAGLLLWTPIAAYLYSGTRIDMPGEEDDRNVPDDKSRGDRALDLPAAKPSNELPDELLPDGFSTVRATVSDVIGEDTRQLASQPDMPPNAAICLILTFRGGSGRATGLGTGCLTAGNRVLTAAHVLKGADKAKLWFGYRDGRDVGFYEMDSSAWIVHPEYTNNNSAGHDLAVIRLDEAPTSVPALKLAPSSGQYPVELEICGYPSDKSPLDMWAARGEARDASESGLLL